MSQTLRTPKAYRPGLWTRLGEGLRYKGGVGQYSWLFHRITGLGILLFLVIHILDTFFVVAYPGLYDHTLSLYGGRFPGITDEHGQPVYFWPLRWAFRLGELGLIACVLFHSINGVRVASFDLWPGAVRHQKQIFTWVMVVFLVLMLIVSYFVFVPLTQNPEFWHFPVQDTASPAAP
jgi:succinate dehydrogenase / fumarate reductase cytochrome b subunit